MPDTILPPVFSADTVLFIGNGIMRVPCEIEKNPNASPSWAEYMQQLWQLVDQVSMGKATQTMKLDEFEKLSAPRQAQWFDENFAHSELKREKNEAVALRLHLLAEQLHPKSGFLTNELLAVIGMLVAKSAEILSSKVGAESEVAYVDVLTTNLDCAIEQNIAHAIDRWCSDNAADVSAEIEVMAGFRRSVLWQRTGADPRKFRVRLWKLHGCLRDLRSNTQEEDGRRLVAIYRSISDKSKHEQFCAAVPHKELTASLGERWKLPQEAEDIGSNATSDEVTTIFSQTEYFKNLALVAQMSHGTADEEKFGPRFNYFQMLKKILQERPLLILGYSLTEGDVDIVFLLQTISTPAAKRHAMLEQAREATDDQVARLKLMGIDTWTYSVSSAGSIPPPGRLRHTTQFEWRVGDYAQAWQRSLQTVSAMAWLIPQHEKLASLYDRLAASTGNSTLIEEVPRTRRLAVAGLGSIWHAFSLKKKDDFPNRRRVSSGLTSVDAQVPGGSGLVPIMQAAAMAGPDGAGKMAFFSNVPSTWRSWKEIEEFCLSGGVDVYPYSTKNQNDMDRKTGRNSYVLLFDHECHDEDTLQPRQRFIMDVNSVVKDSLANEPRIAEHPDPPQPPKACLPESFNPTPEDLLFADKETDGEALKRWLGPKIFETGASGDELATPAFNTLRPQIWTSGIGSLLRTAVRIEGCFAGVKVFPTELVDVLKLLDAKPKIARLIACTFPKRDPATTNRLRRRYPAKLVSFTQRPWNEGDPNPTTPGIKEEAPGDDQQSKYKFEEGFSYQDEVDYGRWLIENWLDAGTWLLNMALNLDDNGEQLSGNVLLGEADEKLGRGILTTIHEGGLMAAWEFADGTRQLIRVHIDKEQAKLDEKLEVQTVINRHRFTCKTRTSKNGSYRDEEPLKAIIEIETKQSGVDKDKNPILEHKLSLRCIGASPATEFVEALGPQTRWNTLAAGDTVRGALAFGLWSYAYGPETIVKPRDIPQILFASAVLATAKCYAGSFVDFLKLLQKLRLHVLWPELWGATSAAN